MTLTETEEYVIDTAAPEDAACFYELMHGVWAGMENKDFFAVDGLDEVWVRQRMESGLGIAARTPEGELAGMLLVCRYGRDGENLGRDLGYPGEALDQVCNLECAAVAPAHRGHGLEARMLAFAEECLRGSGIRIMAMTVAPDNLPSLRSARKAGFRVVLTKKKYGGLVRHVLIKPLSVLEE